MKWMSWAGRVLICAFMLMGSSALAAGLCQTKWSDFQKKLTDSTNRLAFTNPPGPMNIGMCWWHSRMQRNANYLLEFQADGSRPDANEAWQIIKNLSRTDKVQVVSGFPDLRTFSAVYSSEMIESMGQWQMADSFLKFGWVNGLASNGDNADLLSQEMDALYESAMLRKNVVYQMMKMPGVETHSWLVVDMKKLIGNKGCQLAVVDSNSYAVQYYTYLRGMAQFDYTVNGFTRRGMEFTPHTQRDSDLGDFQSALRAACGR